MYLLLFCLCLMNGIVADLMTILETASADPSLKSLTAVLGTKGYEDLANTLNSSGTFTVFAPDNTAFTKAKLNLAKVEKITAILNYHILGNVVNSTDLKELQFVETLSKNPKFVNVGDGKGQVLFIERSKKGNVTIYFSDKKAKVLKADIVCSNGVVHIIDDVVTLASITSDEIKWSGLSNLSAALVKASMMDTVDNTTGITLFAPIDQGFNSSGVVVENTSAEVLATMVQFSTVKDILYTTDITNGQNVTTLQGGNLTFTNKEGTNKYQVNGVNMVTPNVLTKNGVVHFIDAVLMPNVSFTNNTIQI